MLHIVFVTAPAARAGRLARALLKERLIACANLLPRVRSVYRWKGQIESASEVLMILKTTRARLPALMRRVKALHPYEVPEIVAVRAADVHAPYAKWVERETDRNG